MMKNKFLAILFFMPFLGISQVAIGKSTISNTSVSLEFGEENRGFLMPWVSSIDQLSDAVNGTFVYNIVDKKVYVKTASAWKDLSVDNTGVADTKLQDDLNDASSAKVLIGGDYRNDTTPGILVLGDTNKAMILPKVNAPHLNIVNPSSGMIVYDKNKKQLAVFNGRVWSFWKASN